MFPAHMLGTYCETSASPRPVSSRLRRSLPVYNTLKSRHSSNICYRVIASFVFLASTVSRLASRVSLLHSPQPGLSGLAASLLAMKSLAHGDRVTLESRRSPGGERRSGGRGRGRPSECADVPHRTCKAFDVNQDIGDQCIQLVALRRCRSGKHIGMEPGGGLKTRAS